MLKAASGWVEQEEEEEDGRHIRSGRTWLSHLTNRQLSTSYYSTSIQL